MERSANLTPIAQSPRVFARRYHHHGMPAVDVALTPFAEMEPQRRAVDALLKSTLQAALCVSPRGSRAGIRVLLDNVAAGHAFPSGSAQDRRLWVEVVAYKDGQRMYQSGVVPEGKSPVDAADPDLWLFRGCMKNAQGEKVDMFQVTLDRNDPRFFETHLVQRFPRNQTELLPAMPDRVTLRVRLQPIGLDVLDLLVASGDLDPALLTRMPTFDLDLGEGPLLEWTPNAASEQYVEDESSPCFAPRAPTWTSPQERRPRHGGRAAHHEHQPPR